MQEGRGFQRILKSVRGYEAHLYEKKICFAEHGSDCGRGRGRGRARQEVATLLLVELIRRDYAKAAEVSVATEAWAHALFSPQLFSECS